MNRPATIAFAVVTALGCMALVYFQRMGWMQMAAAAKLIASFGYLATAISAGVLKHRFGQIIFTGLVLSMFGDLFLIGQSQQYFLLGLQLFVRSHRLRHGVRHAWSEPAMGVHIGSTHHSAGCSGPLLAHASRRAISCGSCPGLHCRDQHHGNHGIWCPGCRRVKDHRNWCTHVFCVGFVRGDAAHRGDRVSDNYLGPAVVLRRSALPGGRCLTFIIPIGDTSEFFGQEVDERAHSIGQVPRRRVDSIGW